MQVANQIDAFHNSLRALPVAEVLALLGVSVDTGLTDEDNAGRGLPRMTEIRAKCRLGGPLYWRLTANPGISSRAAIKIAQGDLDGYNFDGNRDS